MNINDASSSSTSKNDGKSFEFPKTYSFPPFFTIQPTEITKQAQLKRWSALVQEYCRFHRIYQFSVVEMQDQALFNNATLKKRLVEKDIRIVLDFMVTSLGDERAEWTSPAKASVWIWWKKPEEWGNLIANWVEETGQKGTVLTLYEIVQGESTEGQEFYGLDMGILQRSLAVLAKKGKAQVFGTDDQQGVKFF